MVWNVRLGSTTTVGAADGVSVNATVPRSVSLSVPSGVVIHTWAVAAGAGCAEAVPGAVAATRAVTAISAFQWWDMGPPSESDVERVTRCNKSGTFLIRIRKSVPVTDVNRCR